MVERTPQEGWHKPSQQESIEKSFQGSWHQPATPLSPEQLAELSQTPPPSLPEPDISSEPITTGAWYRPYTPGETAVEMPPVAEEPVQDKKSTGLFEYLARINTPAEAGNFDPSKSNLLEGIQPDLGKFDEAKSGALGGIGSEPTPEISPEPDLGTFDASKSGAMTGLGATESSFDASQSGQLEGLAAASASDSTANPAPTKTMEEAAAPVAEQVVPDKYSETETKVTALRQQYQKGEISRDQLQDQLRQLMVLDDAGRWWMLGVESNRWYRYDGKDWLPDEPPRKKVAGAAATATGLQQVPVTADAPVSISTSGIELDEYGMPLPSRVPVDDPQATLVNQHAVSLAEHRSWEAPTQQNPLMPAASGFVADSTVPAVPHPQDVGQFGDSGQAGYAPPGALGADAPPKPRSTRKMNGIQPDYSAAFSGYWDRATMTKIGLRVGIFGTVGVLVLSLCMVLGLLAYYFSIINKYTESIDSLGQRAAAFETTIIYDAQGNVIAEFNDPEGGARKSVPLDQISPYLIHATVSTEDETYYENPGFSLWGIGRAVYQNLRTRGGGGGASTITQQLTRALVLDAEFASQRSAERKIEEIIVAAEIARRYSKNEILEFYLNEIYYGNQAYGIEAASQLYFKKPAQTLNPIEAAFLAGLPQAPAFYDPVVNRTTAIGRMQDVLRLMTEANGTGCIQMQHGDYAAQPFCFTQTDLDNAAVEKALVEITVFQPPTFSAKYPHYVNFVRQELESQYESQRIYSSGFRVYTTLNPSVQDAAQAAVLEEIPITPGANNGSVVAIRPSDGALLALIGSADFNNEEIDGQVNVAFSPQQPGSTMKPFVYLGAIEGVAEGDYWYPGTIIWDVPSCFGNYCPTNYDFSVNGPMTMRLALVRSMNVPAVKGLAYTGPDRLTQMLERFGVRLPGDNPTNAGLPSALGAVDVYLFDMTAAYAALANGGVRQNPYAIARIENIDGEIVYQAEANPVGVQVARPEHVYLISDMLSDPTIREAQALNVPGWRTAAKTGTTNENRDVLTIGYTTDVAVGVWVGRTDNKPMGSTVFGSNTAAPIWNKTMQAALAGIAPHDFPRPQNVLNYQVCADTGAQYSPVTCTGNAANEVAFANQPPPSPDQSFIITLKVDSFTGLLANDNCPEYVVDRSFLNITDQTAIQWLTTNPAGQAWAQQRNIQVSSLNGGIQPTESCSPGMPRPQVVVTQPQPNSVVSGLTEVRGTVNFSGMPFVSYEFQLANAGVEPPTFQGPLGLVSQSQQLNPGGPLNTIDFTPYAAGNYILRLVAKGQNDAQVTIDIPIQVANLEPTPIPFVPTPTFAPTLTPSFLPTTDPLVPTTDPFQAVPPTPGG